MSINLLSNELLLFGSFDSISNDNFIDIDFIDLNIINDLYFIIHDFN